MQAYLFVHFRQKDTPDGEQIYFSISKDGYYWEVVFGGLPVLWCDKGEKGARDFTIVREKEHGKFYIIGTDLGLAYNFKDKYHNSWTEVASKGSIFFSMWESEDLVNWSEQKLISVCDEDYGCAWAPDIIYDESEDSYILHWSSTYKKNGYKNKGIFYSRTKDFLHFTKPEPLYFVEGKDYIDSAIYEENGIWYMFLKSENILETIILLKADKATGPYKRMASFDKFAERLEKEKFEAPTAVQLEDGNWNLFLDYYGNQEDIQGYIPFEGKKLKDGIFERKDGDFYFPYRFKHGTILPITIEEYERIKNHTFGCRLKIDNSTAGLDKKDLFGVFFEDLNHAADGGLYGELIQNRDFEFSSLDNEVYTPLTAWEKVGAPENVHLEIKETNSVNYINPHYLWLETREKNCGVRNIGYNRGIYLVEDEKYRFSCYARGTKHTALRIVLCGKNNERYGDAVVQITDSWKKYDVLLECNITDVSGRLALLLVEPGSVSLDFVSLFRENETAENTIFRKDLTEAVAELKPAFFRFPGGCLVHCGSLNSQDRNSMYRWKNTIGSLEKRPARSSNWHCHQTLGLGYYEYFIFSEKIGAKPVPVIPAGFDPHTQNAVPLENMQEWVDEALDLIEFANGDTDSQWGAVRAEMGHPASFKMEYLGIGNEEQGNAFFERFAIIQKAVRKKYPEIKVICSSGPFAAGGDFENGWFWAGKEKADLVDEHYYQSPEWFIANHHRYDNYKTEMPLVFLGEYASKGNTWFNALTEASYMIGLERNADKVKMACYAPLFCNVDYINWNQANMIWFDNYRMFLTANYYVQKLFMNHQGDRQISCEIETNMKSEDWSQERNVCGEVILGSNSAHVIYTDICIQNKKNQIIFSRDQCEIKKNERVSLGTTDNSDYKITFTATQISEDGEGFTVIFGKKDEENQLLLSIGGWNRANNTLDEMIHGKTSTLTQAPCFFENNKEYRVEIQVFGSKITVYVNDVFQFDAEISHVVVEPLYCSVSMENKTQDMIIKIVNLSRKSTTLTIPINEQKKYNICQEYLMSGYKRNAENSFENPDSIKPLENVFLLQGDIFTYHVKKESFSVLRLSETIN